MSGKLYLLEDSAPLYHIEEHPCGVSTEIRLDPNTTATRLKIKADKWKPKFCPHCGKPVSRSVDGVLG